jgi:hypothetical protein
MAEINSEILPSVINFKHYKADTFDYQIIFNDDLNNPIDLTTFTSIEMQVRKKPKAVDILWEASVADGGFSISGVDNNVLDIFKEMDLPEGEYVHDLQFTYSNGKVFTGIRGSLTIVHDTTRDI